jgi:hypothetical protein
VRVIFGELGQWAICEWCGAAGRPSAPCSALQFLVVMKEFLRQHRFCEPPMLEWPPKERASLLADRGIPEDRLRRRGREPGDED